MMASPERPRRLSSRGSDGPGVEDNMMKLAVAFVLGVALLPGCGSRVIADAAEAKGGDPASTQVGTTPCTVTLSGPMSATFACTSVVTGSGDDSLFQIGGSEAAGDFGLAISVTVAGSFEATGYSDADVTEELGATSGASSAMSWGEDYVAGMDAGEPGDFALSIASVGAPIASGGGSVYVLHGSYTATWPASVPGSAQAPLEVKVTF